MVLSEMLRSLELDMMKAQPGGHAERPRIILDVLNELPAYVIETVRNVEQGRIYTYGAMFAVQNYKFNLYLICNADEARYWKFSTEIFERYQRSEKALVAALTEMYSPGSIDSESQSDQRRALWAQF